MKLLKIVVVTLTALLTVLVVVPLTVLAGLFVWLKLTEADEEELLDLDLEDVG